MEGYKYPLPKCSRLDIKRARSGGWPRPARGPAHNHQTGTSRVAGLEPGLGRPGGRPPTRHHRPRARPRPVWGPDPHQTSPAWSPAKAGLGAGPPPDEPGQDSGLGRFGGRTPIRLLRPGARPRPVWGPASLLKLHSFLLHFRQYGISSFLHISC